VFSLLESKDIAGLDKNELLNDKPEAKITQLQTLYDIVCILNSKYFEKITDISIINVDRLKTLKQMKLIKLFCETLWEDQIKYRLIDKFE